MIGVLKRFQFKHGESVEIRHEPDGIMRQYQNLDRANILCLSRPADLDETSDRIQWYTHEFQLFDTCGKADSKTHIGFH